MNIYVANIPYRTTDQDLRDLFEQYGPVDSAKIIMDRDTGRSRGFAFVEMANRSDAERAISELNGSDFQGRAITVNQARSRR